MKGFPKPEVNWTKDGKLLDTRNMLTINRVTHGDVGQYQCSAKNSGGKSESAFHITFTGKRWLNFVSFPAQVLLKLILSSRISQLPITRRLSSFALWEVSLYLRYSGLRMEWIAVTTTLSRFAKRDRRTLVHTPAAPKTVKEAKPQLSGSKWREVWFLFTYRKNWSR